MNHELKYYAYDKIKFNQATRWYHELLEIADSEDELEYTYKAYRDSSKPDFIDYEDIPYYKEIPIQLNIIFDAFDEICKRLKK